MAKRKPSKPRLSAGELEMMSLLWRAGSVTLSEAQQQFGRPIGYTTIQTRLNRLVDKGLVLRTEVRPATYSAAVTQEDVSANQLDTLLDRVTGGRIVPLVAQLVTNRTLTKSEIQELKRLVRDAEQRLKTEGESDA